MLATKKRSFMTTAKKTCENQPLATTHPANQAFKRGFPELLDDVLPFVESRARQCNQAAWLLETTGSQDAARLQADLETELRVFLGDPTRFSEAKHAKN